MKMNVMNEQDWKALAQISLPPISVRHFSTCCQRLDLSLDCEETGPELGCFILTIISIIHNLSNAVTRQRVVETHSKSIFKCHTWFYVCHYSEDWFHAIFNIGNARANLHCVIRAMTQRRCSCYRLEMVMLSCSLTNIQFLINEEWKTLLIMLG